jgi:hypothetical protein
MKTLYPTIQAYTPDFNLEQILGQDYLKRRAEKYLFVVHSIMYQALRNKKQFSGYVNLNAKLLEYFIGPKFYKETLKTLIKHGVVEELRNATGKAMYQAGAFSRAYRIAPQYTNGVRLKSTPITKQTYCRKIAIAQHKMLKEAVDKNPLLKYEFLNLTRRRIDAERAEHYIRQTYDQASEQFKSRLIAIRDFDKLKDARYENGVYKLGFHFSYKGGRVYSPASMLPRDLEQFTYFDNEYQDEQSVCLDMPNSQLCFFNELVLRTEIDEYGKVKNIGDSTRKDMTRNRKRPIFEANINPSIHPTIETPYVLNFREPQKWADIIFNGLGYERMMYLSQWKGKAADWSKDERQEFKAEFFGQLFYNKYSDRLTDLEIVFMQHHEAEAKALRSIKKALGNRLLAVKVQELEGKFFHHIVVTYLKTNYKEIPFTIKHDSLTIPVSCADFLKPEIDALASQFFRRNVNLKADVL